MKRQPEQKACWNCGNYTFKRRNGSWPFCLAKDDWFPLDWDFSLNRDIGVVTDCKKWE